MSDAYLTLKVAGQLFQKSPAALAEDERKRVEAVVSRQTQIESRILATPEAAHVVLPPSAVDASLATIRGRYDSEEACLSALAANGLDEAGLREAIAHDLVVEAVLEGIASRSAGVSDTEVEIFYLTHVERFRKPETRALRHILVTINEKMAGNERGNALARIADIRDRAAVSRTRFEHEAQRHSECPTGMNGGYLGRLPRGQLFAELESTAFLLAVDETSAVLESPLGFHLVRCDAIDEARQLGLDEVRASIREQLNDSRRRKVQKEWIAGLFSAG